MNGTQPIETITPLKVGEASPRGCTIYKIVHPDGSWTVRNLTESAGIYTGSFTPFPETFSANPDVLANFDRQRRYASVMAAALA